MRRSLRIGLEVVGTLVAGLVILAGFAAYRLSEGNPFRLGFLVPAIERALAPPDSEFRVKLDDLVIAWTGGQRLIGLRATHVRAVTKDGHVLVSVPQIGISLSLRALMRGLVAPTEIEVFNPRIHLRRNRDGQLQFLAAASGAVSGQPTDFIPRVLEGLMGPPNFTRATGYLRRAHVIDGSVDFDDQRTGVVWHAPKIDIELSRDRQGIVGRLSSQIKELGDPALLDAAFVYDTAARDITVDGKFNGVDIAGLGLIAPDLTALSGSHFVFNGTVGTKIGIGGDIGAVHFSLGGGPGTIDLPGRFEAPVPVTSLLLAGQVDSGFDSLSLGSFALDLGGPQLSAKARLTGLTSYHVAKTGHLRVAGEITAQNVPVRRLPGLWPLGNGHADNARRWVVGNIDEGQVDHAKVAFDVAFAGGSFDNPQVLALGGDMKARNVGLHYFRPLPPIRGADGTARFDATKFLVDFTSGGVNGLQIRQGNLAITGLEKTDQLIAVKGDVDGPLKDALQLLDHPRLGYPRKIGLDPAGSAGTASTHLTVQFAASKDLTFEQVRIGAHARIEQARLAGIFMHRDLTDGKFELKLDDHGMLALGQAKLAGIPSGLRWESHFGVGDFRNRIGIDADTTTTDLSQLGFDYSGVLDGPLGVKLVYTEPVSGLNQVAIAFDLAKTSAAIDFAKWKKPPGVPARADIRITMEGDRPVAISEFRFAAGDFTGNGQGRFDAKGKLAQIGLNRLALGKTRLDNLTADFVGERVDIRVEGGEIDAEPYMDVKQSGAPPDPPPETRKPTRPYTLTAEHLDRIITGPDRQIEGVRLVADYDGLHWQRLEADGTPAGGKPMTLRWLPAGSGAHQLSVVAEDAGSALKVLGVIDNVVGGRLTITGTTSDNDPRRAIKGTATVSEYRLVNQSALVRLLTIATLTGIADAMTGEGFQMYGFEGDFTKTGARVDIPFARTWGPSIGLTAAGFIDYNTNRIDVTGTVVPAYALNSLVGQIPIVGYLLTGGKGSGIFAAVYTATGKLSEPSISVNALSALAPGFLRGVFGLFADQKGNGGQRMALPPNYGQKGTSK